MNARELVVYGLPHGETERYTEVLLAVVQTQEQCSNVEKLAGESGYHSFRTARFNWDKPNFTKVVNTR